jgi:hypothetical protein
MASASVPINYDYAKISDVNKLDKQNNSSSETRYRHPLVFVSWPADIQTAFCLCCYTL